ncbi:hypothetical protein [Micromonospora sp. NPDC003816]|uniref:hypothetical protein n=1 Tax=Micromonospora sp. NPDC003816 TaxID=3364224 RepID=UPI003675C207
MSVDPIQDMAQPQQWHGYSYANNSPIIFSDPSGLYATGDNEGHLRDYSPKPGSHKIVDHRPKVSKTTEHRPPTVLVHNVNYTVKVDHADGQVFLNTYPVPPGMSAPLLASLLKDFCQDGICDEIFKCGNFMSCAMLNTDQEAAMAISAICSQDHCTEAFRWANAKDSMVLHSDRRA